MSDASTSSKDVVYPSVEWALLQGDRCRNYGPEHTRVENENVIVILADEVERLRPMAESRESYEAAQERKGSAVETQPVASNLVRKLRDAAWRYHPESVLAATLNVAAAEIEKLNGTRAALTRLMKAITHSGIAYEVPDIKKSQEIIHAYHDARELLESLPVETTDDIVRDARRYRRLQILGCAVDDHHLKAGTVSRFTNLDTIVDADLNAHPSRGEDSPLEPTEPRMPLEHYRTENGKLRKAMADLMHKCPRCRAEAKEALSAMTRKVHHPRCELMQPHGHEPPKCTCPSEKATDAPYLPFARKCDRCKKLVPSRRPVTSDVFYCSIECAD